jgi:hypothetical protein
VWSDGQTDKPVEANIDRRLLAAFVANAPKRKQAELENREYYIMRNSSPNIRLIKSSRMN